MSHELFQVSDVNPNEAVGGGGCLCSDVRSSEQEGPFVVFYNGESTSNISPHAVVCAGCIRAAADRIRNKDHLSAGEKDPIEETTSNPPVGDRRDVEDDVPEV